MGPRSTARRTAALLAAGGMLTALSACAVKEEEPDLVAGKQLFVQRCGACHQLARAGTRGQTGPNLDAAFARAIRDGMGRDAIAGMVRSQIANPADLPPTHPMYMPADLVTGDAAKDVSAYVASVAAAPGRDTGLLATAVKPAGGGRPAVARDGVLRIPADPNGQLAFVTNRATAEPGRVELVMPNPATIPHNIAIEGAGVREIGPVVNQGGTSRISATVRPGQYTYFCSVPGHREGGMEGRLTVRR
jgi:mono/diheme cytochrome c family protein